MMLMISVMTSVRMMMIVMRDCISVDSMIPDFLIKTFSTKKFRFKQVYSGQS